MITACQYAGLGTAGKPAQSVRNQPLAFASYIQRAANLGAKFDDDRRAHASGPAVDGNGCAVNDARLLRAQKEDYVRNLFRLWPIRIIRLRHSLSISRMVKDPSDPAIDT